MRVKGKGKLRYISLDERNHPAILHANNVGCVLFADIIRTISETNSGSSGLHLDVILDRNGHSEQWREMPLRVPLFSKSKIIFSCFKTFTITLLSLS
jgi:hypothetical protein